MSERGERDPKKDVVLGVSPQYRNAWEKPLGEFLTSFVAGDRFTVQRGDMTSPVLEGLREYLPGKLGDPQPKKDSVVVYEFRASDAQAAIKRTEPDKGISREFLRKKQEE